MNYAFTHEDKVYGPAGLLPVAPSDAEVYNRALETAEIEALKHGPDRLFLYVNDTDQITTWLGTVVSTHCYIGPKRKFPCYGYWPSVRRAVTCRIFGVLYVGWYFTSSGSYCRLKRSKRQ